ncbi:erythromycin esterase family protein [Streptomyces griseofuscus]|uniref:erythromycin esterase family protein n=1 Tax=Streptomyces griseofuscus TaxID=146922 RepID=UPI0037983B93
MHDQNHHDHDTHAHIGDLRDLHPAAEPALTAAPVELTRWVTSHSARLADLGPGADPEGPLHDLEPLRDLVGDARVVALGESSHQIREFGLMRRRILRFLIERLGFTVYAMEYGAAEGRAVDAWVQGGSGDIDDLLAPANGAAQGNGADGAGGSVKGLGQPAECGDTLRWLRRHNSVAAQPVRFVGCDIPMAGGSLRPVLEPVAAYLTAVDPGALPFLNTALEISEPLAGGTVMVPTYARLGLEPAVQDRLTAALARLLGRFTDLREVYTERGGAEAYATALSDVRAAVTTDRTQRAMAEAFAGTPDGLNLSARERYLADTLLELLDRSRPGIASCSSRTMPTSSARSTRYRAHWPGHLLSWALGKDYVPLALTGNGGETVENVPDPNHPLGMRWGRATTPDALPDSVEALFAGVSGQPALVDTRALRAYARRHGLPEPVRTRVDTAFIEVPALDAFDGVICVPDTTLSADLPR